MNGHAGSLFLLMVIAFTAGCRVSQDEVGVDQMPSACKIVGNGNGRSTCMTFFPSVLAAPDQFDGKKISIGAWVDEVNDVVLFFPTSDAMKLRDSSSSVVAYPGKNPGIGSSLKDLPKDARYVRVKGIFHWLQDGVRSSCADPIDSSRMGVLEEVSIER